MKKNEDSRFVPHDEDLPSYEGTAMPLIVALVLLALSGLSVWWIVN